MIKFLKDFAVSLVLVWLLIASTHIFVWFGFFILSRAEFLWEVQFILMWAAIIPAAGMAFAKQEGGVQ